MMNYNKELPFLGHFEVIVAGSGSAGSSAAIAAGRLGAKTLLLERLPFLGGTSTAVLDTFYGFYTPGSQSHKIVGGVGDDVVKELRNFSMCLERPNTFGAGTGITYHPEYLKVVWERLAIAAGVKVLLNAWGQDVVLKDKKIVGLVLASKNGLSIATADIIIDTTGDADICHQARLPYELAGEIDPAQTLTTTFKMVNVDIEKRKTISKEQFHEIMAEAAEGGKYNLPRKEGSDHITPVNHMTATIMTRIKSFQKTENKTINATDAELLSRAEIEGRLQALEYIRFLKDLVPGYEHAELSNFSTHVGVRETRRIRGHYCLSAEDVLAARQFEDQIGLCGAPMEDHHDGADTKWKYLPEGKCVGIPYRTLIPQESNNILVAGRCFSASHEAHSSVRSMAQCMAMGQAAGTAAALAAKSKISPDEIDINILQQLLVSNKAIIEQHG